AAVKTIDLEHDQPHAEPAFDPMHELYAALVLGVRDYLHKSGARDAILGLSGGIDSAVTAVIAVAALGREHVLGVTMPSRFSSKGSVDDSVQLARNLKMVDCIHLPIHELHATVHSQLA